LHDLTLAIFPDFTFCSRGSVFGMCLMVGAAAARSFGSEYVPPSPVFTFAS
jgi:hypothetical protein